jgi:hypothetical protein
VIEDAAFPAPLLDGKTIAYMSKGPDVWVGNLDDDHRRQLFVARPCCGIRDLSVSPDGSKLLYHRDSGSVSPGPGLADGSIPGGTSTLRPVRRNTRWSGQLAPAGKTTPRSSSRSPPPDDRPPVRLLHQRIIDVLDVHSAHDPGDGWCLRVQLRGTDGRS